jgi:hypothetical protein
VSWRIRQIGVYSRQTGALSAVDFHTTGLNIVTGVSSRGKSALLDIVDYCLCRAPVDERLTYFEIT